jgi:hypothetical protein
MSGPPVGLDALPPELAQNVEQVCDRYEAAWRGAAPPRIKDFLNDPDPGVRTVLLRELVLLEVNVCVPFRDQRDELPLLLTTHPLD